MDSQFLNLELATIRTRTRRLMGLSAVVHVLVGVTILQFVDLERVAWVPLAPVEIVLLSGPAAAEAATPEPDPDSAPASTAAANLPAPGSLHPAIQQRLAPLQATPMRPEALPIASASLVTRTRSRPAPLNAGPNPALRPSRLARAVPAATPPGILQRGGAGAVKPALAVPTGAGADASAGEGPGRIVLPGVSLSGQVADRALLSFATPVYPPWAKSQGIEASVRLVFTVLPVGIVKESVQVEATSGFADFDASARDALLQWRFEPSPGGATDEQWGRITFQFQIRDTERKERP